MVGLYRSVKNRCSRRVPARPGRSRPPDFSLDRPRAAHVSRRGSAFRPNPFFSRNPVAPTWQTGHSVGMKSPGVEQRNGHAFQGRRAHNGCRHSAEWRGCNRQRRRRRRALYAHSRGRTPKSLVCVGGCGRRELGRHWGPEDKCAEVLTGEHAPDAAIPFQSAVSD